MTSLYFRKAKVYGLVRSLFLGPIISPLSTNVPAHSITIETVMGWVLDPSLAFISNLTATLKTLRTRARQTIINGANGTHQFAFLEPGNHTESAVNPQFRMTIWQAEGAEAWAGNVLDSTSGFFEGGMAR